MTIRFNRWLALLILPTMSGCYPNGAEYVDEYNLIYTNYDNTYAFGSKHTYAIPDSVIKITGEAFTDPDGNHKPEFTSPTYAIPLLNQIKASLNEYGWTQVSKFSNPDVIILPSTTTTTNIYYYYDWYYWSWYYPYWDNSWGWYYPGYYPSYVSGYRSGSVFIQMIGNTKGTPEESTLPIVWNSIINGLAEGSTTDIVNRIQNGVKGAFAQSPYLKH